MSNGIGKNPLNDISEVYRQQISEKKKDDSYLETDMKKREANNEKARKELAKGPQMKNPHFEEKQLDPVGQEDADIDNDGDVDKSDKYLGKRRKAIAKAMKKRMKKEEVESEAYEPMTKERQMKVDRAKKKAYDADQRAQHKGDSAEADKQFKRRMAMDSRTKMKKESFSNWRTDLIEVAPLKDEEDKEIKEKKVNNKVTVNPKLGEEVVSEMGGTMIEMVEYDEFDGMVEGVYFELQEEGYIEDDIEEALEWVLTEAKVTYGSDTESPKQQMMKKAKGRLRFLGRKIGGKMASAKKKAGMASAQAQVAAYNKAREVKQSASDTAKRIKKSASDAPKKAKKGLKAKIKGAAEKVASRMSEENIDEKAQKCWDTHKKVGMKMKGGKLVNDCRPKNEEAEQPDKQMLAKKKQMMMKQQMLDRQRLQAQQQGKLPSGHRTEQKESMSAFEKVKADLIKKHGKGSVVGAPKKKVDHAKLNAMRTANRKPDTRTDAEKMADATGPRKGSNYRGD